MTILKDLVHIDFCWQHVQNISSSESWHNLFICILFWSSKTQLIVESGFLGGCQSCRKSDLGAHIRECHHQSALVSQAICANEVECLQSAWLAQTQPKKFCNLWWPNDLTSCLFVTTEVLNQFRLYNGQKRLESSHHLQCLIYMWMTSSDNYKLHTSLMIIDFLLAEIVSANASMSGFAKNIHTLSVTHRGVTCGNAP